jgi:hypothetical protein
MRVNNSMQIEYEKKFNEKINYFKNHPKYEWLRKYSNEALNYHTQFGALQIKAIDFMDRIIAKPLDYIRDWLDNKNNLEW